MLNKQKDLEEKVQVEENKGYMDKLKDMISEIKFAPGEEDLRKTILLKIINNPEIDYTKGVEIIRRVAAIPQDQLTTISAVIDIEICDKMNPDIAKKLLESTATYMPVRDGKEFAEELLNDEELVSAVKNSIAPVLARIGVPLRAGLLYLSHFIKYSDRKDNKRKREENPWERQTEN